MRPDANVTHERFFDLLEKEIQKVHTFTDRKVSKRAEWERREESGMGEVGVGLMGGLGVEEAGRGFERFDRPAPIDPDLPFFVSPLLLRHRWARSGRGCVTWRSGSTSTRTRCPARRYVGPYLYL